MIGGDIALIRENISSDHCGIDVCGYSSLEGVAGGHPQQGASTALGPAVVPTSTVSDAGRRLMPSTDLFPHGPSETRSGATAGN